MNGMDGMGGGGSKPPKPRNMGVMVTVEAQPMGMSSEAQMWQKAKKRKKMGVMAPMMPDAGREHMGHLADEPYLSAGHNTVLLPGQQPYTPPNWPHQPKGTPNPLSPLPAPPTFAQAQGIQGSVSRARDYIAAINAAKGIRNR